MKVKPTHRIIIQLFVLLVLSLYNFVPCFALKTRIAPPQFDRIRVLLDSGINKAFYITYNSRDPVDVLVDGECIFQVKDKKIKVLCNKKRLRIGTFSFTNKTVSLRLHNEKDYFTYKKRKFLRNVNFSRDDSGKTYLVHSLPLEEYLSRVVPAEMAQSAPYEALKAQAITARTYSIYNILERRLMPYDLTLEAQAVGPPGDAFPPVSETSGTVLTLKGHIIPAFFHTTCGGYTEYSVNVWRTHYHYSRIIRCPYCKHSKHFSWKAEFSHKELEKKLLKSGYKIRNMTSVLAHSINPETHRVTKILIKAKNRKSLLLSANNFRIIVGSRKMKSTFFTITNLSDRTVFKGKGYGHGVGMCQDGASQMGKNGKTTKEITTFYFPETELKKIY